jgi:hypothetical protein
LSTCDFWGRSPNDHRNNAASGGMDRSARGGSLRAADTSLWSLRRRSTGPKISSRMIVISSSTPEPDIRGCGREESMMTEKLFIEPGRRDAEHGTGVRGVHLVSGRPRRAGPSRHWIPPPARRSRKSESPREATRPNVPARPGTLDAELEAPADRLSRTGRHCGRLPVLLPRSAGPPGEAVTVSFRPSRRPNSPR